MKLKATCATQHAQLSDTWCISLYVANNVNCDGAAKAFCLNICVQTNLELFKTKTLHIFNFGTEDALYMLAIAMADQFLTTLQS